MQSNTYVHVRLIIVIMLVILLLLFIFMMQVKKKDDFLHIPKSAVQYGDHFRGKIRYHFAESRYAYLYNYASFLLYHVLKSHY